MLKITTITRTCSIIKFSILVSEYKVIYDSSLPYALNVSIPFKGSGPIDIFIGFNVGKLVVYDPGVSEYRCIFAPTQEIHTHE